MLLAQFVHSSIVVGGQATRRKSGAGLAQATMSSVLNGSTEHTLGVNRLFGRLAVRTKRASPQPLHLAGFPRLAEVSDREVVTTIALASALGSCQNTLGQHQQTCPRLDRSVGRIGIEHLFDCSSDNTSPRLAMGNRHEGQSWSETSEHILQTDQEVRVIRSRHRSSRRRRRRGGNRSTRRQMDANGFEKARTLRTRRIAQSSERRQGAGWHRAREHAVNMTVGVFHQRSLVLKDVLA